jgi:hypothetical protein
MRRKAEIGLAVTVTGLTARSCVSGFFCAVATDANDTKTKLTATNARKSIEDMVCDSRLLLS